MTDNDWITVPASYDRRLWEELAALRPIAAAARAWRAAERAAQKGASMTCAAYNDEAWRAGWAEQEQLEEALAAAKERLRDAVDGLEEAAPSA